MDNYTDICKYEYKFEYLSHNAQKKDFSWYVQAESSEIRRGSPVGSRP